MEKCSECFKGLHSDMSEQLTDMLLRSIRRPFAKHCALQIDAHEDDEMRSTCLISETQVS